jgi:hypothetical protein
MALTSIPVGAPRISTSLRITSLQLSLARAA